MLETLLLAAWIAFLLRFARAKFGAIRATWTAARWYERCAIALLFVPIPGPVDEIIAGAVIVRVRRRMARHG